MRYNILHILLILFISLTIISCNKKDDSSSSSISCETTTTTTDYTTTTTDTTAPASCTALIKLPTITGCNGVELTAASSIDTQSSGIISTPNGFGSSTVFRIEDEQYIDLKDEGCLQLGKDGEDFALSMWLKASGASTDQTQGSGSQIIGTKSQYNQATPGFLLHTEFADASHKAPDGWLILGALSSPADNSQRKFVLSAPFPTDTWTHVVLNYQNDDYNNSKFSIYVNLIGNDYKGSRAGAHPNIYKSDLRIGDEGWGQIRPFEIADFKSYSRMLTERERKALFLSNAHAAGYSVGPVISAIDKIGKHIAGEVILSSCELKAEVQGFVKNSSLIDTQKDLINNSLDLVDAYENGGGGPLFLNDNTTVNDWSVINRIGTEGDGKELHRAMFSIQQTILDEVYNTWTVASCPSTLQDHGWLTANYFPGTAPAPENPNEVHSASINASVPAYWGRPVAFATDAAHRPTGFYLSPGSIGKVTVPQEMVDAGYSIMVGSHTIENTKKDPSYRFERVTRNFPIVNKVTPIANPLGGGVYILVPHKSNLGQLDIQLSGVIKQPYFSLKESDNTTDQEWQERRTAPGPWAVFETDKYMLNVPRSWIYAFDNATSLMQNWDKAMDGVSELLGYPLIRNHKVLYMQVDVYLEHGAFGIGYPQINNTYNPREESNGNSYVWFLRDPTGSAVEVHELGHAQLMQGFWGEGEAIVNFPFSYVLNEKFGVDNDTAFQKTVSHANYTVDDAAIHWMITENFRNGNPMDNSNTTLDEFRYQQRGYAKYGDIARLFGWQALKDFLYQENLDFNAGKLTCFESPVCRDGLAQVDSRILRLSKAAGADLTPLIHFWGVHPDNSTALAQAITAAGLDNSTISSIVRDKLVYYGGIAPINNAQFNTHFETVFPGRPSNCASPHYGCGWYNVWTDKFNESHGSQITTRMQSLLSQYFPGTNL
ncbi:MAG: M60 family metallopeptidase [Dehalococcoidia bacterium]|nr:M60 family metallopeptidase [Dehalococcoidia bacterium]